MARLILLLFFLLLSLLTLFAAPTNLLWYVSILVTEFPWIFLSVVVLLLWWRFGTGKYHLLATVAGLVSLILFALPIIGAYRISAVLNTRLEAAFLQGTSPTRTQKSPFHFWQMITGTGAKQILYRTLTYDTAKALTLNFYSSTAGGKKPCVLVVHGGSWAGGDSRQLPELNSFLAKRGHQVASINYRLAPQYKYPSPLQDVQAALNYLRYHAADLHIDTNNFVLLGRSAGAQIVLSAAYTLTNPGVKGVISFYGPTDMVWGYANPCNPLVLNSRKVMEDYLGGTYAQVPQQYIGSSATETATAHAVPTLLIYGQNDPLVAYEHSTRLSQKLQQYSVKHFILTLPWATHGCDYTLNGPSGQLATYAVERFLQVVTK